MVEAHLDYFAQAMLGEAAAMKRRMARANEKKRQAAIMAAINESRARVAEEVQKSTQQLLIERNKKLAALVTQSREKYWQHKQKLLHDLFDVAENRINNFVASDAYPRYMQERIHAAMRVNEFTTVQLMQRDIEAAFELPKNLTAEASTDDFIGGFILINEARTQRIDYTLLTQLKEAEDHFDERFGGDIGDK
ncbi:MAG: hypothetical protein FWC71_00220 [Defluviitaleaceae bacterium]|nr:hypothetical protein [Defluviitaleaceae bacterium]